MLLILSLCPLSSLANSIDKTNLKFDCEHAREGESSLEDLSDVGIDIIPR